MRQVAGQDERADGVADRHDADRATGPGADAPTSKPTSTATPQNPTSSPTTRAALIVSCPVTFTSTAATRGTAATSSPVSELDTCVSAEPSRIHGAQISISV